MWEENGKKASTAGTKMHYNIECYYNDMDVEVEEDCLEWKYFEEFEKEIGGSKEPYRTEWMIWDKELKFAGSIDMTYINKDGTIDIYDWKRSGKSTFIDLMREHLSKFKTAFAVSKPILLSSSIIQPSISSENSSRSTSSS